MSHEHTVANATLLQPAPSASQTRRADTGVQVIMAVIVMMVVIGALYLFSVSANATPLDQALASITGHSSETAHPVIS